MTPVQIVFGVILILLAIVIIALVMKQEGNEQGLGAISGGASESFFGRNKGKTNEARMNFVTKICVAAFCVLALVAVVVMLFV
ncbi:MAG: preprotein translocase subunit SecG [Oscillospiraceae bacterium]|nr:preprotein translocase subunit SecG [Oscillospiraceae bacterium]